MNDSEIINALKCCSKDDCDNCPMGFGNCFSNLARCAIDLINRQQAEIEELKIENQSLRGAANSYKLHYDKTRTEAVKEFAEWYAENFIVLFNLNYWQAEAARKLRIRIIKKLAGDTE